MKDALLACEKPAIKSSEKNILMNYILISTKNLVVKFSFANFGQ